MIFAGGGCPFSGIGGRCLAGEGIGYAERMGKESRSDGMSEEAVRFPSWESVPEGEADTKCRESIRITIRWYLGWCRRFGRVASVASAVDFLREMEQRKSAKPWALESWKAALRWFFREARKQETELGSSEVHDTVESIRDPLERRLAVKLRTDNHSLRTEKAYRGWFKRYRQFLGGREPMEAGRADVERFLEHLAAEAVVASGTPP